MKYMKRTKVLKLLFIVVTVMFCNSFAFSQSAKVNSYLRMIAEGRVDFVRTKLPELIKEFGEEPGVLLLQGVVLENAAQATPFYRQIIEKFPNSEWAPHAAWRLIQYYSIVTDTATAKRHLEEFRKKHPTSPFLAPATDAVRLAISDAKFKNRENYLNPPRQSSSTVEAPPAIATEDRYGLQVGIYSTRAAAEAEKERFITTAKLRTEVLEKIVRGERRFAVVIGDYKSEAEALQARSRYVEKQCNCKPLVYKK